MYSTTMTLQPATMATKPLTQAVCYDIRRPVQDQSNVEARGDHARLERECWSRLG
jgi:hypothetical protein